MIEAGYGGVGVVNYDDAMLPNGYPKGQRDLFISSSQPEYKRNPKDLEIDSHHNTKRKVEVVSP